MKKFKLSLIAATLALSCGGGLLGMRGSSTQGAAFEVEAASTGYQSFFGKPVCEITLSASSFTANPAVLSEKNKIVDPSYVYVFKMAEGVANTSKVPTVNYNALNTTSNTFSIVLSDVYMRSGDWSPVWSLENECFDKVMAVNLYIDGTNQIMSHNWNSIVCRTGGTVHLRFSTTEYGLLSLSDRYGSSPVLDERGFIECGFDDNVNISSISLGGKSYTNENLREAVLQMTTAKQANMTFTRNSSQNPTPSVTISSEVCTTGEPHLYASEDNTYNWSKPSTSGPDDPYDSCTAKSTCKNCGHKISQKAYEITNVKQNPTCEEDGYFRQTANFRTIPADVKNEIFPATGHSYSIGWMTDSAYHWKTCDNDPLEILDREAHVFEEPSYIWLDDYNICQMSRKCAICDYVQTLTTTGNKVQILNPTCSKKGMVAYSATFTVEGSDDEFSDSGTYEIPELGHTFDNVLHYDSSYHWNECTREGCNEKGNMEYHTYEDSEVVWAEDGSSCHIERSCKMCEYVDIIPGSVSSRQNVAPTCESNGSTIYTATFDSYENQFTKEIYDVPATGHEFGTEYYHDDNNHWNVCINKDCDQIGNLAAHDYNEPDITWAEDGSSCHMLRSCKVCGYVQEEDAEITSAQNVAPTCEEDGSTLYTATFSKLELTSTKEIYNLGKLGHEFGTEYYHDETNHWNLCVRDNCVEQGNIERHTYGEPTIHWENDGSACYMERECDVCGYVEHEDATITSIVNVAPNCEEDGSTIYTATFSKITETSTKEIYDVPALGHTYGNVWYNDETSHWNVCTRDGCDDKGNIANHTYGTPEFTWAEDGSSCHMSRTCTVCGYVDEEDASITSAQNVAPLCLEKGSTIYTAHFNKITDTPTKEVYDLDALGHDFAEEFTYDETHHWHVCNNGCDVVDGKEAHTFTSTITKMPTTEEEGIRVYTCTICGYTYEESVDKLPLPPNPKEMSEEEYEEQQKQYEEQRQQIIEEMTEVISDVIEKMEEPDPSTMTEEEYAKEKERYDEKQEAAEQMAAALETINEVNSTDTSEVTTISPEAKQQAQENVVAITEVSSGEMNALAEEANNLQSQLDELLSNPEATEEEIEAIKAEIAEVQNKKDTAEIITTQAVVVTAKQTESEEKGATICDSMPEGSDLNMGEVYNEFMQKQIDELLGQQQPQKQLTKALRRDSVANGGFDYTVSKDVYKQVGEFVDDSVEKMGDAALKIRNCTGERTVTEVKNYITVVKVSSFRDFDKEAADEEFALMCYDAILVQMQSEVLASLEANKPMGNNQAAMDQYNEEVAAVSDIEEFEIIVTEVLRQKYFALTGNDVELDEFHDRIYWPIFRAWALNKEVPADIFPDGNVITLEELTKATVNETTKKGVEFKWEVSATPGDTIFIIIMASVAVVGIGAAIVIPTILKRKED